MSGAGGDGIAHYCVANMPAAVSRTSTFALNNVTLPFTIALADKGWRKALMQDPHLRAGLNTHEGQITCQPVAEAHGLPYTTAVSSRNFARACAETTLSGAASRQRNGPLRSGGMEVASK